MMKILDDPQSFINGSRFDRRGIEKNAQPNPKSVQELNAEKSETPQRAADKVEISDSAKGKIDAATFRSHEQQIAALQTLSNEDLQPIRQRIREGFYNREAVMDQIAGAILNQVPEGTPETSRTNDTAGTSRLDAIRENIEKGKYDRDDVLDTIIDRMFESDAEQNI